MNELADQTGSTDTGKAADRLAGKLCDFYEVCSQNAVQNKLKASLFFGHVFSCHRRSAPSIPPVPIEASVPSQCIYCLHCCWNSVDQLLSPPCLTSIPRLVCTCTPYFGMMVVYWWEIYIPDTSISANLHPQNYTHTHTQNRQKGKYNCNSL